MIKINSDFYFTAASWFPGNVRIKSHSTHSAPTPPEKKWLFRTFVHWSICTSKNFFTHVFPNNNDSWCLLDVEAKNTVYSRFTVKLRVKTHLFYSNALSFNRSQNVLDRSKFFVPDQRFIYILWQSQTFCARQKDDLHSVKLFFVPAQKFLKRH